MANTEDKIAQQIRSPFTADDANLRKLTRALGATYELSGDLDGNAYDVGHSPYFFILNPKLQWSALYTPPIARGVISNEINKLNSYVRLKVNQLCI